MISDKGNKISSTKLTIWIDRDDRGFVEVACHPRQKGWKRKFEGITSMLRAIEDLHCEVQTREQQTEQLDYHYCDRCNTMTIRGGRR